LHWLGFGGHVLWNTSGTISEDSSFGDVLHSLLGYADRPTVLQAVVWFTYLVVSTVLFIRLGKSGRPRRTLESQATMHSKDGRITSP
jgi:high-affinity iron transporter